MKYVTFFSLTGWYKSICPLNVGINFGHQGAAIFAPGAIPCMAHTKKYNIRQIWHVKIANNEICHIFLTHRAVQVHLSLEVGINFGPQGAAIWHQGPSHVWPIPKKCSICQTRHYWLSLCPVESFQMSEHANIWRLTFIKGSGLISYKSAHGKLVSLSYWICAHILFPFWAWLIFPPQDAR